MANTKKRPLHEQIKELEAQGYEVDIEHNRDFEIVLEVEEGDELEYVETERVKPTGGLTRAKILKNGKLVSYGDAVCNKHDNYNRKIGGLIALGRAKKRLLLDPVGINYV